MNTGSGQKVMAEHLKRNAYLYVRQSTLQQVVNNTESTERQYDLRQRAIGLGWQADDIVVIDSDLAQSAKTAADREGFQHLVSEVGLGRAGIVLGLEVYNVVGIALAATGRLHPTAAALLMVGSSLIVTGRSLGNCPHQVRPNNT